MNPSTVRCVCQLISLSWYSDSTEPWIADILCSRFNLTAMRCFAGLYCVLGKEQVEKRVPWTPIGENKGIELVRCPGAWIHKEQIPLVMLQSCLLESCYWSVESTFDVGGQCLCTYELLN